jgi:hypothetical protein
MILIQKNILQLRKVTFKIWMQGSTQGPSWLKRQKLLNENYNRCNVMFPFRLGLNL